MTFSPRGLAMLKTLEGYRAQSYPDSAQVWTIGYGTTRGVKRGDCCTVAQAAAWLDRDLGPAIAAVTRLVTVPLNQDQFDALVLFAYNVGVGALQSSALLRKLNAGDSAGAAAEFPRWDHAGGREVPGLLARREREQALFRSQQVD